ncbi:YihY/virulence factor BrkB family protein [Egicoccus halophilus]|uniref:Ribonuclease n=1 Tax=Egicoccus halophilus TaxID=1670830 RepID=A0A8J3AAS3_9ACTN|nr:YihY/virulence factor BrkB family protein [Egicoccus halophilus]GGI06889.1 ribonuclease [Egicoccus halophilus]
MGLTDRNSASGQTAAGSSRQDEVIDVRNADERADEARRDQGGDQGGDQADDGRGAQSPTDIPAGGWKAVGKRVVTELKNDHVSLLAAGVAFKALLALFPTIIAAITIWGLVADPEQIEQQVDQFAGYLPDDISGIITDQMSAVAEGGTGALSFALVISLALALWSASGGMAGLMEGVNAAYNEVDRRKFPIKRGLALALTLGGIVFLLLTLGLIAVLPAALGELGLGQAGETAIRILQWPVLALLVIGSLGIIYKVAPDRDNPGFKWVSIGAVVATVLWLLGSAAFTLYVENFGNFGETYGAFAGVIVLMLWLLLTGFVVLLGAEINAEQERQTQRDTTVGEPEPLGTRGANAADTTPEQYEGRQE